MSTESGAPGGAHHDSASGSTERFPGLRLPEPPRRFAVLRADGDDEPALYLWGLQTADRAVAFDSGGGVRRSASAECIADRVDMIADAYLVWLDPAPDPAT